MTVSPGPGRKLDAKVSQRQAPHPGVVSLHSVTIPDGLGTHKWTDRSLLEAAQAGLPADGLPLIVDSDGAVLEASRANVFAVRDGVLLTPPLDGRILPGITRMRVLELATSLEIEAAELPLSRDDLLAAEEVFLTGSVRGIEPARSLDGEALATAGHLATELDEELRRTWTAAAVR